jgi:excisionase family DNA binding protein
VETTIIPIPSKSKGEYMTLPQLAEYLQISKSTIFSWIYQRKIPYSKIGRRVTNEAIIIWTGILSFHHPGFRLPPE